jgi:DNA-binding LacI/PurR family transcriptional regulator
MSSIKDIAELAGVSVPTVYKVLSNDYKTGDDVKEKVLAATEKLNYTHKIKKKRAAADEKVVALIFSEAMNPFTNSLIDVITKELNHSYNRYRVIVLYSNENKAIEEANIELVRKLDVDALVYTPVSGYRFSAMEKMIEAGKPIIQLFSPVYQKVDTILFDDELGTYLAIKTFLQNGHKKILMIYKDRPIMPQREPGYYRAFREYGLDVDENYLFKLEFEDSIRGMIKGRIEELRPTAILTVNESISIETVQALNEMKISIPKDISLVVYDNLPWAIAMGYTTVAQSFDQIGSLCRDVIIKRSNISQVKQAPAKLVIDPMVISRGSVKNLALD